MPRVNPVAVNDVGVLYCPIEICPEPPKLPETGSEASTRFGMVKLRVDTGAVHIASASCVRSSYSDEATMVTLPRCNAGFPPVH
jgi:hypothetical protein